MNTPVSHESSCSDNILESKDFKYFQIQHKCGYGWFVNCSEAVVIAPIRLITLSETKKDIQLGLIKIFRPPIGQISWELPGGAVEQGESPDNAARRELQEETNIINSDFEAIGTFYAAPGRMYFPHHVFLALNPHFLTDKDSFFQEIENIYDFSFFSLKKVNRMLISGEIVSGPTISALSFIQIWWRDKVK